MNIRHLVWQLQKQSWEPIWSYQLNPANTAHSQQKWTVLEGLLGWLLLDGLQQEDINIAAYNKLLFIYNFLILYSQI